MNRSKWWFSCLLAVCATQVQAAESNTNDAKYQAAVGMGFDQGLSAILEVDNSYRLTLGNDGMAGDYIFNKGSFDDPDIPFDWYVGGGVWKNWDDKDDFGIRAPLGISWDYKNRVQLYGQVNPELVLHDDVKLDLGGAIGVTYKF
jgi:hypothetical protein